MRTTNAKTVRRRLCLGLKNKESLLFKGKTVIGDGGGLEGTMEGFLRTGTDIDFLWPTAVVEVSDMATLMVGDNGGRRNKETGDMRNYH